MKRIACVLASVCAVLVCAPVHVVRAADPPPNVVIVMTDDQRFDMVTGRFMPSVDRAFVRGADPRFPNSTTTAFRNAFVPNSLCCPSRTAVLTGDYSHTTGVWTNNPPFGGLASFVSFGDSSTIATDFRSHGYRTAMIGKYLNGYSGGVTMVVPPGWDRWFATKNGAYYDYGVTAAEDGRVRRRYFGSRPADYSTRVFERQASDFVDDSVATGKPFFLYYAFTAPHHPWIPDPRDIGRFADVTSDETGTPMVKDGMLEAAYGTDRAIGDLLDHLPAHTIVLFMSDNGYLWGEEKGRWGSLVSKQWPYNESIRIPMTLTSLDGTFSPAARGNDIVLNVDLRRTLTGAAGITPPFNEGLDLGSDGYTPRTVFPLEHLQSKGHDPPTYCGAREIDPARGRDFMYVRYHVIRDDGTDRYREELYAEPNELRNVADSRPDDVARMRAAAQAMCSPPPPGYGW